MLSFYNKRLVNVHVLRCLAVFTFLHFCMLAYSQETYQSAAIVGKDLNGTARYVAMGGALEALGADLSTAASNPAGIGVFRHSQTAVTIGLQAVDGNGTCGTDITPKDVAWLVANPTRTRPSFDQIGAVVVLRTAAASSLNLAFNYHKSRNFHQLLSVAGRLDNASQNMLAFMKQKEGAMAEMGGTQLDYLYAKVLNGRLDADGKIADYNRYFPGNAFRQQQVTEGYVADYDFTVSGNVGGRLYLGFTAGLKDVNYQCRTIYQESLSDIYDDRSHLSDVMLADEREIEGTAFDFKFGAIYRPFAASPLRVGAYVHTPTWYELETRNRTTLYNNLPTVAGKPHTEGNSDSATHSDDLGFHLHSPWLFGLSVGHTIGNSVALGVTYEFADYGTLNNRVTMGEHYNLWLDRYTEYSSTDRAMKALTKQCLEAVHTLRIGAEVKPCPQFALRVGYNFVSPKYSVHGFRNQSFASQGNYYASTTDYVNWRATHRLTAGVGIAIGHIVADVAYQYATTAGEYYPFMSYRWQPMTNVTGIPSMRPSWSKDCVADMSRVTDRRHQVAVTVILRY